MFEFAFDIIFDVCVTKEGLFCITEDIGRLKAVLDVAQKHIHSSSQLFKLAQDVFKIATPPDSPKHMPALNAAFELGLQVRTSWHYS